MDLNPNNISQNSTKRHTLSETSSGPFLFQSPYKIVLAGIGIALILIMGIFFFVYQALFGAPEKQGELEQFTIAIGKDDSREVETSLKGGGFIKNKLGFRVAFSGINSVFSRCVDCIMPGAYKISKGMSAGEIVDVLKAGPYLAWVIISEGLRKEEIAEILASTLRWDEKTKNEWVNVHTATTYDETEGVYFPDTYLIPVDEEPAQVAERIRAKFNEKFAPYAEEAFRQNIRWPTLLRIASIVQREAAGKEDISLIAGIIWNRLLNDQKLDIDATLQYIKGNAKDGWWPKVRPADKEIDSPYNTYKYKGLPPHPISNPGIDAIEAVLFPEETKCFYYLHDDNKNIHCANTYEEHQENIKQYLQ
ncbi:MAG: endolytic transglycosylase MltG [Parcubacteria group bacterium]|nr:endolytic transglycosylase MltG [Parcubacteria group bacterium]